MIEIKRNDKKSVSGFDVLHSFDGWKTAFISYAEQYGDLKVLKRHTKTDEAFLLIKGSAILFFSEDGETAEAVKLEKEKIYIVKKNTWHHLKVSPDALIMVVENSDTSKENTETKIINDEKAVKE